MITHVFRRYRRARAPGSVLVRAFEHPYTRGRRRGPGHHHALIALIALVMLGPIVGCSRSDLPVQRRLLFVGIDSADWSVANPLIAAGRLPNLARLMESGISCDLRSLEPKEKSPVIWTTIATGKLKDKHGIGDYIDADSQKLFTSNVRTARTFWDMLGERGSTVTVIGWLVSWPAEEVNGCMVTDYFRYAAKPGQPAPEHLTYPEDLVEDIESHRVIADDLTDDDISRFVSLDLALTTREAQRLPMDELFVEMRSINTLDQRVDALKSILAGDRTFLNVARRLMSSRPTEVFIIYLRGADSASHRFWAAAHPGEVGFDVSRTEAGVFGKTVERYYELWDEMLGELLERFGPGATVILCSDHGFEGPKPGQTPGGINDHGPIGILVMAGEGIKKGVRIGERCVTDITPTLLALYGLPVAEDMDGDVIDDALTEEFLSRHPVKRVASYEREEG